MSASSPEERLHDHLEDQRSAIQFHSRSQQQVDVRASVEFASSEPVTENDRDPLKPYVPDESPPEPYHSEAVQPQRLGSYSHPRPMANLTAPAHQKLTSQRRAPNQTAPVSLPRASLVVVKSPIPLPALKTYVAWSIVSIFMCPPLGIAALIYTIGAWGDNAARRDDEAQRKFSIAYLLIGATLLFVFVTAFTIFAYKVYEHHHTFAAG